MNLHSSNQQPTYEPATWPKSGTARAARVRDLSWRPWYIAEADRIRHIRVAADSKSANSLRNFLQSALEIFWSKF